MSSQVERRAVPTLMGGQRKQIQAGYGHVHTLLDLLQEGFYLLFMLKNGSMPPAEAPFLDTITAYLAEFDREARKLRAQGDDIDAAKYAFCAALDEIILSSQFPMRPAWERRPLQLVIFGDQLAGEHFFDQLEALRSSGGSRLPALQVFHMCLLIGFRGKYAVDASDKLAYLTARLGDEIAHMQGKSKGFAPQAERPDQIVHKLRSNASLWAVSAMFGVTGLVTYIGLDASLSHTTEDTLAAYSGLVKLAPRPAYVTITLP
ncbi:MULTISPECIES: type IVB secretion system protein IcmH/DotU [unclassified Duganella]|uniref:type IVB secretion system protein IcmH/DotU n=1 Tax=unclassified Duganella TaxID=2636909 RepID=UPI000885C900|nr:MULTISPECIES: type IVB secretion system protein IcmH/DotU [unclassified Duganella]SDF45968.1 type VI secretion system protein ImpK [Duganella sp. OV458]SDI80847.1 type VI secretion system protein ImpK [Duganella sp. OV510]